MEKKKLDWIIGIVREEMMTANAAGQSGGFSADSPAAGPRAGISPVMGMTKRKKPQIKLPPGSRKRWMKPKE
jgi:hypothetical protein